MNDTGISSLVGALAWHLRQRCTRWTRRVRGYRCSGIQGGTLASYPACRRPFDTKQSPGPSAARYLDSLSEVLPNEEVSLHLKPWKRRSSVSTTAVAVLEGSSLSSQDELWPGWEWGFYHAILPRLTAAVPSFSNPVQHDFGPAQPDISPERRKGSQESQGSQGSQAPSLLRQVSLGEDAGREEKAEKIIIPVGNSFGQSISALCKDGSPNSMFERSSFLRHSTHAFLSQRFRGLYKGLSFPFASQLVFKSVMFASNGFARRELSKKGLAHTTAGTFACGAFSGTVNGFIVAPVELVRTKLMLQFGRVPESPSSLRGPIDCVRQVVRRHGVLGMWQGLSATILRDAVGVGMVFTANSEAKIALMRAFHGAGHDREPGLRVLLLAGSVAGISYWAVALPLDTVKTVIQGTDRQRGMDVPGVVATISRLVREGGIGRLYSGWPAALARGIPGAAIIFSVHGQISRALKDGPGEVMTSVDAPHPALRCRSVQDDGQS